MRPASHQVRSQATLDVTRDEAARHRVAVDAVVTARPQPGTHPGAGRHHVLHLMPVERTVLVRIVPRAGMPAAIPRPGSGALVSARQR